jgi:hypothetical protein
MSLYAPHGFFDAMPDGGLGVAFFAPFTNHRYFFPWRPIPVAPLSLEGLITSQGGASLSLGGRAVLDFHAWSGDLGSRNDLAHGRCGCVRGNRNHHLDNRVEGILEVNHAVVVVI